ASVFTVPPPATSTTEVSHHSSPEPVLKQTRNKKTAPVSKGDVVNVAAPPDREYTADRPRRDASKQVNYKMLNNSGKAHSVKVKTALIGQTDDIHPLLKVYRLSINQAFKDQDRIKDTLEAANREIKHLYETLEALRPVRHTDIPKSHYQCIINGHLFFKDKYAADGTYSGRKGRLVMNGNEENPYNMDETRSPTINPISLFACLAVAANHTEYELSTYDVVSAFSSTKLAEDKIIIVRIRKGRLVDLFIKAYPELREFLGPDGHLYFYLTRFLYGLAEAAKAFYDRVCSLLTSIGYTKSSVDEALFIKTFCEDKVHYVCVHVDDSLSLCPCAEARRYFEEGLKSQFEIKEQHGNELSYLGMLIVRNPRTGVISVNQKGFIDDLLKKHPVNKKGNKLTKVPAPADLLSEDKTGLFKDKHKYISMVMSLMYLARLTRPDILMPVSFLSTKAQSPTLKNYKDIQQVVRYVSDTRDDCVVFSKCDLKVKLFADASHLTHPDGRGHTGIIIFLGKTFITARSVKQKVQARSSTEAEIIAAEECATYIPFLKGLLHDLKLEVELPFIMGQDNKSCIHMMVQGGQFQRTKHMLSRVSFLKDMVNKGLLICKYIQTADMVADLLTKPLPSRAIARHKAVIGIVNNNIDNNINK
ncbi:MAG TPA: Ty1/Copia family ribonuclease HI, partial [Anaerolineales bacterium]|nr:Ty1/Copia family ribonuclease HI [Anaerolineales bacterium]